MKEMKLLSIDCRKLYGQLKSEIFDHILKSRTDYVVDSIPDVFRKYYEQFTPYGDKPVYDTLKFYDMLMLLA